jgi:hypothetical protein
MTLVALHPEAVRSAVLDSIYPPDPMPLWSAVVSAARDAFFVHCAQDEACSASFPDLAGTYRETLDRLDRTPLIVAVPPQLQQPNDQARITAPYSKFSSIGCSIFRPLIRHCPASSSPFTTAMREASATSLRPKWRPQGWRIARRTPTSNAGIARIFAILCRRAQT